MAIAPVSAADLGNNGGTTNSLTVAYTVGVGSNRLLVVGFAGDVATMAGFDDITSVTYNGVSMTLAIKQTATNQALDRFSYFYYLLNPASGSNNVVINCTNNHFLLAGAADYSGVAQSGQPDNTVTNQNGAIASSLTTSLTTGADNCWVILVAEGYDANNAPGAGTGSTRRTFDAAFGTYGIFDNNADVHPAGSNSMTTTYPGQIAAGISHLMVSFSPAVAGDTLFAQACL